LFIVKKITDELERYYNVVAVLPHDGLRQVADFVGGGGAGGAAVQHPVAEVDSLPPADRVPAGVEVVSDACPGDW
jgi:hypothetical protein